MNGIYGILPNKAVPEACLALYIFEGQGTLYYFYKRDAQIEAANYDWETDQQTVDKVMEGAELSGVNRDASAEEIQNLLNKLNIQCDIHSLIYIISTVTNRGV